MGNGGLSFLCSSPRDYSLLNIQQRQLGGRAFLLQAVESAKIKCSHCCLVLKKAAIKSYSALLLTEQWG